MSNHTLYNNTAFPSTTHYYNVYNTIEKQIRTILNEYNEKMQLVHRCVLENKEIPCADDHDRYIYSTLLDFYQSGYPKELEVVNGELTKSNSRENLPDLSESMIISYVVNVNRLRYNNSTFYPNVPNAAFVKRNIDPKFPGEEINLRMGHLPITVSSLIPNLSTFGISSYFIDRLYNEYIFRNLELFYQNDYSNLVRHVQPTQPYSTEPVESNRKYIVTKVYMLPITEVIVLKRTNKITDINITGTHSIMNEMNGQIPSIGMKYVEKDEE